MFLFKWLIIVFLIGGNAIAAYEPPYRPNKVRPYQKWINKYSRLYFVDSDVIEAIIAVESGYRSWVTGDDSKSQGLMQIQVPSATDMGFRGTASQLRHPRLNIKYGTKYFSWLRHNRGLSVNDALDAYNRGIGRVLKRRWIRGWNKHKYVRSIKTYLEKKKIFLTKASLMKLRWPIMATEYQHKSHQHPNLDHRIN